MAKIIDKLLRSKLRSIPQADKFVSRLHLRTKVRSITARNKVLDASVIIKWFIEEEGSDRADKYLQAYKDRQFSIFVPTLLFYELGNILLAKKATAKQAGQIMQDLHALNLTKVDIGYESFRKVFQNADELQITYYDASYLTLMQKESCEFVTADRRLYEKVRKIFTLVKFL